MSDGRPPEAADWVPPSLEAVTPALRGRFVESASTQARSGSTCSGIPLDTGAHDGRGLLRAFESMNGLEIRRQLVGVFVPAWQELVGVATLERAAAGAARAGAKLLAHDRYYAGRARQSLALLLPLTPAETKRRLLAVLRRLHDDAFATAEPHVASLLTRDAAAKELQRLVSTPLELVAAATGGYVHEPEPEFRRVVLVPHLAARPWLLLCQHRDARLICFRCPRTPPTQRKPCAGARCSSGARWATSGAWTSSAVSPR